MDQILTDTRILDRLNPVPTQDGHVRHNVPTNHGQHQVPTHPGHHHDSPNLGPAGHGQAVVPTQVVTNQVSRREDVPQTLSKQAQARASSSVQPNCDRSILEPNLPFRDEDAVEDFIIPAKPLLHPGKLKETFFYLDKSQCFPLLHIFFLSKEYVGLAAFIEGQHI